MSFSCDVQIGSFCSVAEEVIFMQMADQISGRVSFPIGRRLFASTRSNISSKGPIIVGKNVWIGAAGAPAPSKGHDCPRDAKRRLRSWRRRFFPRRIPI